jgi:hypothetical protein
VNILCRVLDPTRDAIRLDTKKDPSFCVVQYDICRSYFLLSDMPRHKRYAWKTFDSVVFLCTKFHSGHPIKTALWSQSYNRELHLHYNFSQTTNSPVRLLLGLGRTRIADVGMGIIWFSFKKSTFLNLKSTKFCTAPSFDRGHVLG